MNPIVQNVAAGLTSAAVVIGGVLGLDTRYLDGAEAAQIYQSKYHAEQRHVAQLALNTSMAATLLDLRIQQYKYTADTRPDGAERDAALAQLARAQDDLQRLSMNFNAATANPMLPPAEFPPASSGY